MSKKRLYEIAKEVGVESKVIVAKAQELGLSVKSHSSSVEEADANRITSSLKAGTAKDESKPAPKATPTPKEEKVEPKVDKASVAKSAPAKETSKAEVKEASVALKKPKSRNFKAEREARAKAEAERRKNGGGRDNRNRNQQGNDQGKRHNNDRRNQKGNGQGDHNKGHRDNSTNHDRNFQGKLRNDQNQNNRRDNARNNQAGPRIDLKARAAALKAEQNAEYSRQSETRFREEKAAEQRRAKEQEKARKEKQQAEVAVQKAAAETKPAPKPAPVAPKSAPTAQVQDTRRKKVRPNKSRDNHRVNEDGPKQTRNNKWNNQNQVRNQRNSNWNKNKNKKGKNNRGNSAPKLVTERKFHELPKEFEYTEGMTVAEIAKRIKREPAEIVKKLFMMGVMATQNQSLDGDTIELLMVDYGIEATKKEEVDNADIERFFVDEDYLNKDAMVERAPVVTIMGHVDHGKTTLLDTLRNSRVATGEAGGITQHIGAYQIEEGGKKITFLDTPGHAAFTSMRARGASVTDITVLIVAADDGVMPQTIEAINHAKVAEIPIIVAVNKIDLPGANIDRIKQQLMEYELVPEEWGGDTIFVPISAKKHLNIENLLEMVLLVADMKELKANPNKQAKGAVIEARLDKAKGPIASMLVQRGTLNIGDTIVVGKSIGKIRAMKNDKGQKVKAAGPSTPVEIMGLTDVPEAGDTFYEVKDEKTAKHLIERRKRQEREEHLNNVNKVTLSNVFEKMASENLKQLNIIVKADVQGTSEALKQSLEKLSNDEVKVKVIHYSAGAVTESDVQLAKAAKAIIIAFNVRPTSTAKEMGEREEVEVKQYSVIYQAIEDVEAAMKGMLDPVFEEKVIGEAEVRQTFRVSSVGTIAGCFVLNGKVERNAGVRVIREDVVIHEGKLVSLKRFKDDVKEVTKGFECGLQIENYNDLKEGDKIEVFIQEQVKQV